jgi:hypothetical protein
MMALVFGSYTSINEIAKLYTDTPKSWNVYSVIPKGCILNIKSRYTEATEISPMGSKDDATWGFPLSGPSSQ